MSHHAYNRYYNGQREKELRTRLMRKIHAEFPKLRPDLRHSTEELKLERRAFCERALNLRKPLESMSRLSNEQLGKVIEAIKREMPSPQLPGCSVHHFKGKATAAPASPVASPPADGQQPGEIHHLAGAEQVWAIRRVISHLGWSKEGAERFIKARYRSTGPEMLTPRQATALLVILFNIAASRELKAKRGADEPVTRAMIAAHLPQLKRKLGIDQTLKPGIGSDEQAKAGADQARADAAGSGG